jgi:predicted small integral membrane protein
VSRPLQFLAVATATAIFASALLGLAGATAWAAEVPAGTPGGVPEITIRGQRAELAPKISAFVNHIAALQNSEGLARWETSVCPLVSGLPQREGEFIVARVSEIARAAAVPLAGESCRPNLFIVVTSHPQVILREVAKRNYWQVFGDAAPSVVEDFIVAPREVKVWYKPEIRTQVGTPMSGQSPTGGLFFGASPPISQHADASHLSFNATWVFSTVVVVVDQTRLRGESRGQIADYIGMAALAQLKPDAAPRDADTILKLLDVTPQTAPAGISAWDQAFLKALYATDPKSRLQRVNITKSMLRDIVP